MKWNHKLPVRPQLLLRNYALLSSQVHTARHAARGDCTQAGGGAQQRRGEAAECLHGNWFYAAVVLGCAVLGWAVCSSVLSTAGLRCRIWIAVVCCCWLLGSRLTAMQDTRLSRVVTVRSYVPCWVMQARVYTCPNTWLRFNIYCWCSLLISYDMLWMSQFGRKNVWTQK